MATETPGSAPRAAAVQADPPVPDAAPVLTPARTTDGYRFWLIPHTHWDREWYLPFEQFRIRLARVVDEIVEVLETDPDFPCFVLDGQAVVLEDYVDARPHQAARLRRLIEDGRIAIGPSYILPDEYLVSGESLIRNFLMGRQVCERHGGEPMPVGYMPDTFGHVEQLPQILRGFGLDTFVFWRGLGDELNEVGPVFRWRGPDGSEVLAVRQLGSYGNADEFGRWGRDGANFKDRPEMWPEVAALRFERYLEMFGETLRAHGLHDVMLCNGSDHKPIMRDLPVLLRAALDAHPGARGGIVTYEAYIERLRRAFADEDRDETGLPLREGELCGGKDSNVLRGVNSARMELKQANEATQQALFVAETLAALAELRTFAGRPTADGSLGVASPILPYRYPLHELRLAWRELLRNQPHDSISGCSVDEVHRDMAQRHESARQIASRVRAEALAALAGHTEPWYPMPPGSPTPAAHSLVNVLPWTRTSLVELPLPRELQRGEVVAEVAGRPIPAQVTGPARDRRLVAAATLSPFGAATVAVRRARRDDKRASDASGARALDERTIENERFRVRVLDDGSLEVTDRRDGLVHRGLLRFEDAGDRGDEYTFDPVAGDVAWTSDGSAARIRLTAAGPAFAEVTIELAARLPRSLSNDRSARSKATTTCRIRTTVRLAGGVERIDFRTTFVNRALDHRLRVIFDAPDSTTQIRAEGHFGLVRRPAMPVWDGDWWEPPALAHHTSGAVAAGRLLAIGRGLPEYEAVLRPGGGVSIALTLLRCVGWLSREDLTTRREGAGPMLPTPDAQCRGERAFEYSIGFDGLAPDAEILRTSLDYRTELAVGPAGADTDAILEIAGHGFAFGGVKGAEDGDGAIVRLYAGADEPATVTVRSAASDSIEPCRLDEEPLGTAVPGEIEIGTGRVLSLRVRSPR